MSTLKSLHPRFSKLMENAANCATFVLALLLSVVVIRSNFVRAPAMPAVPAQKHPADLISVGSDISKRIPNVNWATNRRTLILALSTACHYCTASAPFFRKIMAHAGGEVKVVGVLPQSVADARTYLTNEGVQLDEIRQIPLSEVGVTGTPTLLLVNGKGILIKTWVGKLPAEKEEATLKEILGHKVTADAGAMMPSSQFPAVPSS